MGQRWDRFTGRSNRPYPHETREAYLHRIADEGLSNAGQGGALAVPLQVLFEEVLRLRQELDELRDRRP